MPAGAGRSGGGGSAGRGAPPPPGRFKQELCKYHASGRCVRGDACWFAHGDQELQRWRQLAPKLAQQQQQQQQRQEQPPPPPQQPQRQPPQQRQAVDEEQEERGPLQDALRAIAAGDYWGLHALLPTRQWTEEHAHKLLWSAAVDACSAHMLGPLMDYFRGVEWAHLEGEGHAGLRQPLVFCVLGNVACRGWERVAEVLRLVVRANPGVVCTRLDGAANGQLPLHVALLFRVPPLEVVHLLAPESMPEVWADSTAERQAAMAVPYCSPSDRALLAAAVDYLRGLREAALQREHAQRAQQQAVARAAEQQRRREQEAAAARAAEQQRRREREQAALAALEQRHREQQQQQQKAQTMTREQLGEALRNAARDGAASVPLLRQLWAQLGTPTADEALNTMLAAMLSNSWAAVQAVQALWVPVKHGDWSKMVVTFPGGPSQHLIFALVELSVHSKGEELRQRALIISSLLAHNPALSLERNADEDTPANAAVKAGAPLPVLQALVPPARPDLWSAASGRPKPRTPLKLAQELHRKYESKGTSRYAPLVAYLERIEKEHREKAEAERRRQSEQLRDAVHAVRDALAADDVSALAAALPAVADQQFKDVRDKVLRLGGLAAWFEATALQARSLDALHAVEKLGRQYGMRPAGSPQFGGQLLEAALTEQRFGLATALLQHYAEPAVAGMPRPPLCVALQHGAPTELVGDLLRLAGAVRAKQGGASQPDAGGLTPEALAVQHGRLDVLDLLLERGGGAGALAFQQPGGRASLLLHAAAHGQEEAALRVLSYARRILTKAGLVAHVNMVCAGVTALAKAVEKLPASPLIGQLLAAGADPSTECQGHASCVHLAMRQGHQALAGKLLEAVPPARLPKLLAATLGKKDRRTLLHLAVEARDAAMMVKRLVALGAAVVTEPARLSPLVLALELEDAARTAQQQAQQEPQQDKAVAAEAAQRLREAAAVCKELLAAWTPALLQPGLLLCLLRAELSPAQRQLVSQFAATHADVVLAPAVQSKDKQVLELALARGDVPLLTGLAAQPGFSTAGASLHAALPGLPLKLAARLLAAGASINQRDEKDGALLVHKAVQAGDTALLDLLLAQPGASILARDKQANSLLHWAAVYCPVGDRERMLRHLVGLEPSLLAIRNSSQATAYDFAKSKQPKAMLRKLEEELRQTRPEVAQEVEEAVHASAPSQHRTAADKRAAQAAEADLSLLGPPSEPEARKRQRMERMAQKLPEVLAALRAQQEQQAQQAQQEPGPADAAAAAPADAAAAAPAVAAAAQKEGAPATGKMVFEAAAAQVMPEAAPGGQAQNADEAFSDDEAGAAGGGEAELAAAVDAADLPSDMDSLRTLLAELPWEFMITRDAWHSWLAMGPNHRRMVLLRLQNIGRGLWGSDGKCKRLMGVPSTLELWRCKLTRGGRIVFEVAADFSEASRSWRDMLRLWVITLDHKEYETQVDKVVDSHRKSQQVRDRVKLVPCAAAPASPAGPGTGLRERLPTFYEALDEGEEEEGDGSGGAAQTAAARPGSGAAKDRGRAGQHMYFPPAAAGHNNYTLLKFYRLSSELVRAVMLGLDESGVDFSFRVSPEEQRIIELVPSPPRTIILLGRSGTGKTTVSVFRMWARWMAAWQQGRDFNMAFITQSATLQDQVAKSFGKLRNAVAPEMAEVFAAAAACDYPTLRPGAIPPEAFPLFLSSRQYLRMLDGTTAQPFFPRRADGCILWDRSDADDWDLDGMSMLVELDASAAADMDLEDDDFEGEEDAASDDETGDAAGGGAAGAAAGGGGAPVRWKRQEVTFPLFREMWRDVASKELRDRLKPGLAWVEICSYIKGSAEAVRSPQGWLSLEAYQEIGRKRAPNFDVESRPLVHSVCAKYQQLKRIRGRFDNADVVAHVFRQLAADGYRGIPIHNLFRDEVQDFTQAELLLDLRVVCDPNGLFLCGDTAQTIARGIGFRFTDIQTLFYEERVAQLALKAGGGGGGAGEAGAGGEAGQAAQHQQQQQLEVTHMPVIEQLKVNYRTHSGILEVASSVVDALKRFFPTHIDVLDRERAFFKGPKPLLLSTVTTDDLAILLSWSDAATSQVEFGAHQVVLVRSMDSAERLPEGLKNSNALVLTVPQSKGLEFEDVFIVNFCSDSLVKDEWRILLQYLEELEELQAAKGAAVLPGRRSLTPAEEAAAGIGELGRGTLRPLAFDPAAHKLLCEELKHLYTAVTRAKNSVVIYDENAAARAPLYFYLARRGLARVVARSLMQEGVDSSDLGITKARSGPAEWAAQGDALLQKGLFDAAARCFERAGDDTRAQYCLCRGQLSRARQLQESSPAEARAAWFQGGYTLLALAVNGRAVPRLLPAAPSGGSKKAASQQGAGAASLTLEGERRLWVQLAARALQQAGERELAVRLLMSVGGYKQARQLLASMGDTRRLADCCRAAAQQLRAQGRDALVAPWLAEAVRCYRVQGQYMRCFELLQEEEGVRKLLARKSPQALQEIGVNAMREIAAAAGTAGSFLNKSRQARLVAAARLIPSDDVRCNRLEHFGCWAALATEVKDPLRASQLLSEHASYAAAIARLLQAADAGQRLPSAALRLLHRLVKAAGSPADTAAAWQLLQQASSGSLAAELPRMCADLALRLACQLTPLPLDPLTCLPLGGSDEAAAAASRTAAAAADVVAAQGASLLPGLPQDASEAAAHLALYAADGYRAAEQPLGELRALAVLAATGRTPADTASLHRGLHFVDAVLTRTAQLVLLLGRAQLRAATQEEHAALRQLEELFHLSGLADSGAAARSSGGRRTATVTSALHDPGGLPTLAALWSSGQAVHGMPQPLHVSRVRQQAGGVVGSRAAAVELRTADAVAALQAAAFYAYQLGSVAAMAQLARQSCEPAVAPPGLAAKATTALAALSVPFQLRERVRRVHEDARKLFPRLRHKRLASYTEVAAVPGSGAVPASLAEVDERLLGAVTRAVFPSAPVDSLPAAVDVTRLLPVPRKQLADKLLTLYASCCGRQGYSPNPSVSFSLWRSATFLLGDAQLPLRAFQRAQRSIEAARDASERAVLIRIKGRRAVPAMLLAEATTQLQAGFAPHAMDAMLFYLERCHAAAEAASAAAAASGSQAKPGGACHLEAEHATWLLELLSSLGSVACLHKKWGAVFLPRAGAEMLMQLPFLSAQGTAEDLLFHAHKLAEAGPDKLHSLWQRLGSALALTMRRLAAAAGADDAAQADAARALLGRLAVAAGSTLASLAVHSTGFGAVGPSAAAGKAGSSGAAGSGELAAHQLPAQVPAALCAALEAAQRALPQLGLQQLLETRRVGLLVEHLCRAAAALGTGLMQVTAAPVEPETRGGRRQQPAVPLSAKLREFNTWPDKGLLHQLSQQQASFHARALQAMGSAVWAPTLADLQEFEPGGGAEVRRAQAGLLIQRCWRKHRERRARQQAMAVLRGPLFRGLVRTWVARLRMQREREAREQAEREEQERQRQDAARDPARRYDPVEAELHGSQLLAADKCPVCKPEALRQAGAAATAAAVPGAGGRGGLNVSAPSFLPHVYTDEHVTAAAAFREFAGAYRERMAEPRGAARRLAGQLEAIPEGAAYAQAMEQLSQLRHAEDAADGTLQAYDARRRWDDTASLFEAADALQRACEAAAAWVARYAAARESGGGLAAPDAGAGADSGGGGGGGGLEEYMRDAAALQAELQAAAAAAMDNGTGNDGGGWSVAGRGGRAAAAAEEDEEGWDDGTIFGILGNADAWETPKKKKGRSGGGKRRQAKKRPGGAGA